MKEIDAFMLMLNKTEEKKLNEKDKSLSEAATEDNDTSE